MIHDALGIYGNARDHAKMTEVLDKLDDTDCEHLRAAEAAGAATPCWH